MRIALLLLLPPLSMRVLPLVLRATVLMRAQILTTWIHEEGEEGEGRMLEEEATRVRAALAPLEITPSSAIKFVEKIYFGGDTCVLLCFKLTFLTNTNTMMLIPQQRISSL